MKQEHEHEGSPFHLTVDTETKLCSKFIYAFYFAFSTDYVNLWKIFSLFVSFSLFVWRESDALFDVHA